MDVFCTSILWQSMAVRSTKYTIRVRFTRIVRTYSTYGYEARTNIVCTTYYVVYLCTQSAPYFDLPPKDFQTNFQYLREQRRRRRRFKLTTGIAANSPRSRGDVENVDSFSRFFFFFSHSFRAI